MKHRPSNFSLILAGLESCYEKALGKGKRICSYWIALPWDARLCGSLPGIGSFGARMELEKLEAILWQCRGRPERNKSHTQAVCIAPGGWK